jgi:hypothetical protein
MFSEHSATKRLFLLESDPYAPSRLLDACKHETYAAQ